jgi:hypothetical protein
MVLLVGGGGAYGDAQSHRIVDFAQGIERRDAEVGEMKRFNAKYFVNFQKVPNFGL